MLAPRKADLAFTMHILSWLAVNGTAAIVEFPGVLYRGGAEQKIRKYLIDNNYVDAVIQLPADLFFGATIATCIIVLKKSTLTPRAKSHALWMQKAGVVHLRDGAVHSGRRPESPRVSTVPLVDPFVLDVRQLDRQQQQFFGKFRRSVTRGERQDLDEQWGYAYLLVRERVRNRLQDPEALERAVDVIRREYVGTALGEEARLWWADLALLRGDFDGAWERYGSAGPPLAIFVNLQSLTSDCRVTVTMIDNWLGTGHGLSPFGRRRRVEVSSRMTAILDGRRARHGRDVVMQLWSVLGVEREPGDPAPALDGEFGGAVSREDLVEMLRFADLRMRGPEFDSPARAFQSLREDSVRIAWPRWRSVVWFWPLLRLHLRGLYRAAENVLRSEEGLPAVGQGWVSEIALLQEIRTAFPREEVVHQGRPRWLGRQSLDIYLPVRGVAIEYQGVQHSMPVARFGGLDGHLAVKERDRQKRQLCATNGVRLIEVFPGYDVQNVIAEVEEAIRLGRVS